MALSPMETAFNGYHTPAAAYALCETVTYKPAQASAITCPALVRRDTRVRVEDESETASHDEMRVEVPVAYVATPVDLLAASGGTATDTITIDTVTWQVREILERGSTGGWHVLRVADKLLP